MSEYCKNCYELAERLHRYKQVIDEIEDIANENKNTIRYSAICRSILKIIQKCEEVNNERQT